jgi:hypothetical protein
MAVYHFGSRVIFAIKKRMPMRVAGRLATNLVMGCMALGGIIAAAQTAAEVTLPEGTKISLQLNDHLSTMEPFRASCDRAGSREKRS